MLPVDVDLTGKPRELTASCSEVLMNAEADRGTRLIELIDFTRGRSRAESDKDESEAAESNEHFHDCFEFAASFAARAFKSGPRDAGNLPNKF